MQLEEVELFRATLREMVRELGMLNRTTCGHDLSPLQSHILIELDLAPEGLGVTTLAQKLCVEKSSMSRTLKSLQYADLIQRQVSLDDARTVKFSLTAHGQAILSNLHRDANQFTLDALAFCSPMQRDQFKDTAIQLAKALKYARQHREMAIQIRPIQAQDNLAIAEVIRQSFRDHQIDHLEGVSLNDPGLECLSEIYAIPRAGYWVIEVQGQVKGGVGLAPLQGASSAYVELQKLYIDRDITGLGIGRRLIQFALDQASAWGYHYCYLETLHELSAALGLYQAYGFKLLDQRIGNTGHNSCGICMLKDLKKMY
ncbi:MULTISPECIES: bifunctional helix-turn-helix transcriptional regulator/GNAT family N-acetyltransferase [unclassified Acinetobacter]|uniref:bifunctional helix-turn-helix transcriptional regulator/GNAT family N-acetyltransferase n=1 Tax=unclassified Acinetobacter TaxID=196816 RepID=UPI0029351DBA|nr:MULTISPECIES: bifunctional helix-turn-helix transcriptional regulator/GNAT family N-acetyltransferase [unclassified Acinetobacter]WOE30505.1 bifunctional helix-turn-helix transcriptional regulator/GNAT family N-acetyltransferase [Acinetobacter sp. SAAs470]WOE38696.1 bifunctional helix-turn-helix transcriptional regulator/GNAT family N-acetyltransferase [Acinetobacter sp. SAAs474]